MYILQSTERNKNNFLTPREDGEREEKMTEKTITLIIRGVPESARKALKIKAAQEGKSMQALIVEILTRYLDQT